MAVLPLPVMFVMDVPETTAPTRLVSVDAPPMVQELVESSVRLTLVSAPVSFEPFFSVTLTVLMLSALMLPLRVWASAVSTA